MLSRESILSKSDLPRETVAVPEWGGDVCVRCLTGAERDAFEVETSEQKAGGGMKNFRARMVVLTACDETGKRLFADGDEDQVGNLEARALDRVFTAALKLAGLDKKEAEALAKN